MVRRMASFNLITSSEIEPLSSWSASLRNRSSRAATVSFPFSGMLSPWSDPLHAIRRNPKRMGNHNGVLSFGIGKLLLFVWNILKVFCLGACKPLIVFGIDFSVLNIYSNCHSLDAISPPGMGLDLKRVVQRVWEDWVVCITL